MKGAGPYIFLLVRQGQGKGTLAQRCVDEFGWVKLSTGDLCRLHISQQTEIGKQIDFLIKSGKLIPDDIISAMVADWLESKVDSCKGIILDGYPRTEQQVQMLFDIVQSKFEGLRLKVIKFDIGDDIVIKRLSNRLICPKTDCQEVYSLLPEAKLAPKQDMICGRCGWRLVQRNDDRTEVIRDRLAIYHQHDPSAIFAHRGLVVQKIDSAKPLNEVFNDFKQLIESDFAL